MNDIHGNPLSVGDTVYTINTIHAGSKAKRFFLGEVIDIPSDKKAVVRSFENDRETTHFQTTILRPME